ncbi:MAG TPA: ABC transporter substrate-binding protein [bacterium]|nr:MAG: hypothetical protein A2Z83_08010 [Omnitrophica bacterium GWA2_52_8]HLD50320.1 ABC transporter substrate-binding protein [bacterium]
MLKKLNFFCYFLIPFAAFLFLFVPRLLHAEEMAPQAAVETFLKTIRSLEFPIKDQARHAGVVSQANAFLDLDAMGQKALGAHWQEASPEEQKEFLQHLWKLIEYMAYPRSVKFMADYEITYPKVEPAGNGFQVHSIIKQKAEGLDAGVDYHVYAKDSQLKIDDIILDEVSIIEDLKGQFDRIIKDSQFTGLLAKMRERLDQAKKENGGV